VSDELLKLTTYCRLNHYTYFKHDTGWRINISACKAADLISDF